MGDFKSVTTRRINRMRHTPVARVWQRKYYEHVIRGEGELRRIRDYIQANPSQWVQDGRNPHRTASQAGDQR